MIGYPAGAFFSYTLWRSVFEGAKGRAIIPPVSGTITATFPATAAFVPVTGITGVATTGIVGTDITLSGTVAPNDATNTTIVWTVKTANATGAEITGNTLTTIAGGTVTVTATIADGATVSTDYTADFEIEITGYLVSDPVLAKKEGVGQSWDGANTENTDGSFTIKAGLVVCEFDFEDGDGDGVDAYDFVEVFYTASGANSSGFKVFNTINDIGGAYRGVSNGDNSIKLELKYCDGGFSIQKYTSGSGNMTIKITKLVFSKGTRYDITFDLGEYTGSDPAPTATYLVDGTQVGPLPAAPYWSGKLFTGWYNGASVVTSATTVDNSFDDAELIAHWENEPTVADFTVAFTADDDTPFEGSIQSTVTISDITADGFTYAQTGGYGPYVMFKITLPDNERLAYFNKVTFNFTTLSGDSANKAVRLVASPTATTSATQGDLNGGTLAYGVSSSLNAGDNNTAVATINIDKGKAFANLTSNVVWVGFYIHSGAISYKVDSIVFSQD